MFRSDNLLFVLFFAPFSVHHFYYNILTKEHTYPSSRKVISHFWYIAFAILTTTRKNKTERGNIYEQV